MIEPIVSGASLGLVLAFLVGPVFFMLLNTSLKKGFVPAAYLAVGVMLSDAVYILIAYFSSTAIGLVQHNTSWFGIAGGSLLIGFGLVNFFKKPAIAVEALELPDDSKTMLIDTAKGFMMNMLNPFVLLFWLGVAGSLAAKVHYTASHTVIFFSSALATVLITDLLKAFLASRLKELIKPGFLLWLNRLSGLGLVVYGINMIFHFF
ncbi:LysE family transporter [soil metagenome]